MFLREAMPEGPSSLLPTLSINSFCAAKAPAVGGPVTLAFNFSKKVCGAAAFFFDTTGFDFVFAGAFTPPVISANDATIT